MSSRPSPRAETGQATVELVAALPLIAVIGALLWQAAITGQAVWLAGSAARAAARAAAVGGDVELAARRALPGSLRGGAGVVRERDGAVSVALRIPAVIGGARLGTVVARARLEGRKPWPGTP